MSDSSKTTHSTPGMPSQGVRTAITLLLMLHLFALFVAVSSKARVLGTPANDEFTYRRSQLRNVPFVKSYLQLLHMDLSYAYNLTYASPFDTDHVFEIELDWTGETHGDEAVKRQLPPADMGRNLRRHRYQKLARFAAFYTEQENSSLESTIPHAVARTMLADEGIEQGNHRMILKRHLLVSWGDVDSLDPGLSDPNHPNYWASPYEADLKFFKGELLITKQEKAFRTAPVDKPSEKSAQPPAKKGE
jgi:hypothetical protein